MAACVHCHKMARVVDEDAVDTYETRMMGEEHGASDHALVHCATFYHLAGGADSWKAKSMVERVLDANPNHTDARTLLGWIELTGSGVGEDDWDDDDADDELAAPATVNAKVTKASEAAKRRAQRAKKHFDAVIDARGGPTTAPVEALMGRVRVLEIAGQLSAAIDVLNVVSVNHSWFAPAAAEKAKAQMTSGDWDAALESAQRILAHDPNDVESLRMVVLYLLSREGNVEAARRKLGELLDALDRTEPRNASLYAACARDAARVSGGHATVLAACAQFLGRARGIRPEDVGVLIETAYQQQLGGEYKGAVETYRRAARIDERDGTLDDLSSLYGTIHCQLLDNQLADATQQLEFLEDVAAERTVKLVFLIALRATKTNAAEADGALADLEAILTGHLTATQKRPFTLEYFAHMDPDLLLQCAELFLSRESGEPRGANDTMTPGVQRATAILEIVCRRAPGLIPAQVLLMRARYVAGALDAAARTANALLRLDDGCADAHLVLSRIQLAKGNHRAALASLDNAVANNFAVRESPAFAVISAQCKVLDDNLEGSLADLEAALKLPGVKKAMTVKEEEAARKKGAIPVSVQDRATVFLLYVQALFKLKREEQADVWLKVATTEFAGTTEEVRVMIAQCELAMEKGDTRRALKSLSQVTPDSPHYAKATTALARIHLERRNDREAYVQCYEKLAANVGDANSHVALGEAYMTVGEPESAVEAFENALAKNPGDASLASKIGEALVITHDFARAVEYYESARAKDPTATSMQMELAALYVRLGRFPEAETILKHLSAAFQDAADPESLERAVECTRMLGEVREGVGDDRGHLETLMHAKTLQETIVARSKGDPEVSHRQRRLLAETCIDIADRMATRHDAGSATSHYEEALKHDEGNLAAMSALAKLKLNLEDTEGCQAMCVRILREDEGNEEASLMLAELMFRKGHAETAIYHFQDLLEKNPGNYRALAQLVQLLRRAGRLDEASRFLKTAETASDDAAHRAGFHFAKGLERRHLGETQEALGHLNRCRADHEWGADAAYEMVDIYISPENQSMWQYDENRKDASQAAEHVRAAEHLLAEVRQRREPKHTVLESYVHMARGTKQGYEKAFEMCAEIVNEDHDNVPALLAVALCHMLEKQPTKAKNTLKRVAKLPYNAAEAEEFERAWLTSAELAMEGGKLDQAQDFCQRCLQYNRSCVKAWRLLGQVCEREQSFEDAAESFERAWIYGGRSDPAVGFRLGFALLKSKRLVDCVDVCKTVLEKHPTYPKIRKDILLKAQMAIKP